MQFDLPKELSSIIKVIGVGGGGSNAVNHMYKLGIKGVDFVVCNTDQQALDISPVPVKIALGASLTEGRGAGSIPEVGKNAAIENIDDIKNILSKNTKMVFITAGMGGGTGTGAAPVIAKAAKDMGILTVGIVTVPFTHEGKKRRAQAEEGINELKQSVDTLLVIGNDKLREIYGNLKITEAFGRADDVLANAAKSIAEIITVTLHVNVDFADIVTVMKESGVAIMGSAIASGENRALKAVEAALCSPLLNDNDIKGARYVLLNITCGTEEITMDELGEITDYIQEAAGQTAEIIKGYGIDETLGSNVNVTIIATGFNSKGLSTVVEPIAAKKPEKIVHVLGQEPKAEIKKELPVAVVKPIVAPTPKVEPVVIAEVKIETPKVETPVVAVTPVIIPAPKAEPIVAEAPKVVEASITKVETPSIVTPSPSFELVAVVTASPAPAAVKPPAEPVQEKVKEITIEPTLPIAQTEKKEIEKEISFEFNISDSVTPSVKEEKKEQIIEAKEEKWEQVVSKQTESPKKEEPKKMDYVARKFDEPARKEDPFLINKAFEEPVVNKTEEPVTAKTEQQIQDDQKALEQKIQNEEQKKKAQERILKLKELSFKLKSSPNALKEMEEEPAYKRRNINLESVPHSSESQVSRFTLSQEDGDDKKINIRPNNSFLHDNVD